MLLCVPTYTITYAPNYTHLFPKPSLCFPSTSIAGTMVSDIAFFDEMKFSISITPSVKDCVIKRVYLLYYTV